MLAILPTHVLVFDADQSQPGSHPRHGAERTAAGRSLNFSGRNLERGGWTPGLSSLPFLTDRPRGYTLSPHPTDLETYVPKTLQGPN